jgi:hypothetical protein
MLLRLFTGCNLGLTGLVAVAMVIACSVMVMMPDAGGETILNFLAGLLVYLPAAGVQGFLLLRRSSGWQPPQA